MGVVEAGTLLHHRLRHDWLARLRELRLENHELIADGLFFAGVHRHVSTRTELAMRHELTHWFGCSLLYEVEAFRAEELPALEDARGWIEQCADVALAGTMSSLEQSVEVKKLHPEWLPGLAEALKDVHRRTLGSLEPRDGPIPAYRWRLPAKVYAAAWDAVERRRLSGTLPGAAGWEYGDLLTELQNRGVQRVFMLHSLFAHLSCETDVTLLVERRFDWMDVEGYLASPTFDWFVEVGMDGEWEAHGW
nr:hypothetical protein [uncultured bacterium]